MEVPRAAVGPGLSSMVAEQQCKVTPKQLEQNRMVHVFRLRLNPNIKYYLNTYLPSSLSKPTNRQHYHNLTAHPRVLTFVIVQSSSYDSTAMATRTLEARFERMSVNDENEYHKTKVRLVVITIVVAER